MSFVNDFIAGYIFDDLISKNVPVYYIYYTLDFEIFKNLTEIF